MGTLYRVKLYCENIPQTIVSMINSEACETFYMALHNEAAKIFNKYIDEVNVEWEKTGRPFGYGCNLEAINPEYVKFVKDYIQPCLDADLNAKSGCLEMFIDDNGDICGRLRELKSSKIYVRLFPLTK